MEYKRFGDGWVRREDASAEWADVPQDDVPAEIVTEETETLPARQRSVQNGIHPDGGVQFAVIRRVSQGEKPFDNELE